MERRTFLRWTAASLPILPGWLRDQWNRERHVQDEEPTAPLPAALAEGERLGKPVLVLCIPEDEHEMYARGEALGMLLTYATRALREALPLTVVVCAARADLAAQRRRWELEGEPRAWLVETPGAEHPWRAIEVELGAVPTFDWSSAGDHDDVRRRLAAWVAPLDAALVAVLVGSEARVHQRAAAVNAAGTFRSAWRARLLAEPAQADEASLRAGAALLYRASLGANPETSAARRVLREHFERTLLGAPLPGSRWASTWGCACEIEGEDAPGIDCGMGFVPEGSRRLLWFYSEGS